MNFESYPDQNLTSQAISGTFSAGRLSYVGPVLTRFGSLATLTENGGASGSDGTGNSMTVRGSDVALKTNVVRIGTHPAGFGLYVFNYKAEFQKFGVGRHFGVLAQEVEHVVPDAVAMGADGFLRVNYGKLGISLPMH